MEQLEGRHVLKLYYGHVSLIAVIFQSDGLGGESPGRFSWGTLSGPQDQVNVVSQSDIILRGFFSPSSWQR